MRIGVTGPNGYVGTALVKAGAIPIKCDVTMFHEVEEAVERAKPDIVIHLAGVTDIDKCENGFDFQNAYEVNILGTHNVGSALARRKIPGAFMSSYHIWAGGVLEKHKEDSKLTPAKNRYGMMKVAGEEVAKETGMKVVRTSYLFNKQRLQSKLDCLFSGVQVVEPAFMNRSFLHLSHFVYFMNMYVDRFDKMPQVLHLAGSKSVSWYGFMKTIAKYHGYDPKLVKARFLEDKGQTPRPWNGGLDISLSMSLGFSPVDYLDGVKKMLHES